MRWMRPWWICILRKRPWTVYRLSTDPDGLLPEQDLLHSASWQGVDLLQQVREQYSRWEVERLPLRLKTVWTLEFDLIKRRRYRVPPQQYQKKEMLAYTRLNHSAEFPDSNSVTLHQMSSWALFSYPTLLSLRQSCLQMQIDALLLEIKPAPAGQWWILQWTPPLIEQSSQILLDRFAIAKQHLISPLILNNAAFAAYFVIHSEIWFANVHAAWFHQPKLQKIRYARAKESQI